MFNVADQDLGKYTLIARNIEGSDECSAVLKEITGLVKPYFSLLFRRIVGANCEKFIVELDKSLAQWKEEKLLTS